MRYKIFAILVFLIFIAACGKGIEVGTPDPPAEQVVFQLNATDEGTFIVSVDESGIVTLQEIDENGVVVSTTEGEIVIGEDGTYQATFITEDGTVITVVWRVEDGEVVYAKSIINGVETEIDLETQITMISSGGSGEVSDGTTNIVEESIAIFSFCA